MSIELPDQIDLRAHHLYSLERQYTSPRLTKAVKRVKLTVLGYKDRNFADHITRVVDNIIQRKIQEVKLTDGHDVICQECPQQNDAYCKVAGIKWPSVFLSLVDQKVAENSDLEIGKTYSSNELIQRIGTIRHGLTKTLIQIPDLIEIARLMERSKH